MVCFAFFFPCSLLIDLNIQLLEYHFLEEKAALPCLQIGKSWVVKCLLCPPMIYSSWTFKYVSSKCTLKCTSSSPNLTKSSRLVSSSSFYNSPIKKLVKWKPISDLSCCRRGHEKPRAEKVKLNLLCWLDALFWHLLQLSLDKPVLNHGPSWTWQRPAVAKN